MTTRLPAAEFELRKLQNALHARPRPSSAVMNSPRTVGGHPSHAGRVSLSAAELEQFQKACRALLDDPRFEHLERDTESAVWGYVRVCLRDKAAISAPAFIAQHAREPLGLVCYAPVEHLTVSIETSIFGIRLLPLGASELPPPKTGFRLEPPVGCVAAVQVRGTSYRRMADRAQSAANRALRVLRVAPREGRAINDWQLRFRLAGDYLFSDGAWGSSLRSDSAFGLGLGEELIGLALSQPVAALAHEPTNDIARKADLSVIWLERARFAGDPVVALLYLFFGLESLLGDTAAKLKAPRIAFRQAMLSHLVAGMFPNPSQTYLLYDQVRSAAVHGEDVPSVSSDDVREFDWVVRQTLNEYLTFARSHGFVRRRELVQALDTHPDRRKLVDWLRVRGGKLWSGYISTLDRDFATSAPV